MSNYRSTSLPMDTTGGTRQQFVRNLVAQMNAARPGATALDSTRSRAHYPGARHGSAERDSDRTVNRRIHRSREREDRRRDEPAGPEEEATWLQALENVNDRLDTLERTGRLHAQTLAHTDEEITNQRAGIRGMSNDFEAYKEFITTIHKKIDSHLTNRTDTLQAQIESILSTIVPAIDSLEHQCTSLKENLAAALHREQMAQQTGAMQPPPGIGQTQMFNMSPNLNSANEPNPVEQLLDLPLHAQAPAVPELPRYQTEDPWHN